MNQTHDRSEGQNREEARELRAVVALLRGLPDPEPPDGLEARVMAEVRRRESGPRVLRGAFRRLEPWVAAAVAAGVGALVFTTAMQGGRLSAPTTEPGPATAALQPSPARRVATASPSASTRVQPRVAPIYVSLPGADLHAAHLRTGSLPSTMARDPYDPRTALSNPLDRRLDRELNRLLMDPSTFYARLAQMPQSDRFVTRLVERANRRGDAAHIALRLRMRSPEHPNTAVLVERLLRTSMRVEPHH